MQTRDLGSYIAELKKKAAEEIATVNKAVDKKFELSAVIAKLESRNKYQAVMFNHVKGSEMPVISNLFATRKRMALALGCDEANLHEVYRTREDSCIEPKMVKTGPVKEGIRGKRDIDLTKFPIVTHNEKDAG